MMTSMRLFGAGFALLLIAGGCGSRSSPDIASAGDPRSTTSTFGPIVVSEGDREYDQEARATCQDMIHREVAEVGARGAELDPTRDLVAAYDTTVDRAVDAALRSLERLKGRAPEQIHVDHLEAVRRAAGVSGDSPASVCWVLGDYPVLVPGYPDWGWNVWLLTGGSEPQVLIGGLNPRLRPHRP